MKSSVFACYIALVCTALLTASSAGMKEITVVDRSTGAIVAAIPAVDVAGVLYFPIAELQAFSIPVQSNLLTKKVELTYHDNLIVVTAFTPFVQVNAQRLQMSRDVLMLNGEFLAPAAEWTATLQKAGITDIDFDPVTNRLSMKLLTPTIVSIFTEKTTDAIGLHLKSIKKVIPSDISSQVEKEWIYIDIKGSVFESAAKLKYQPTAEIFELTPHYLGKAASRLALHVAPGVILESVEARPAGDEILINLKNSNHNNTQILDELALEHEKWKINKIIIDPGHGGKDPGCVGPNQIYEKNITLAIARAVKAELEKRLDVEVILTRNSDTFVPLERRTQIANQSGGKLFISIHVDANRVKSLRGHTIYFMGPAKTDAARQAAQFENSVIQLEDSQNAYAGLSDAAFILAANAQNSYNKESQDLASLINEEIQRENNSKSIGVRQAGFYVLYGASMPNVLIETGFMTNSADRQNLSTSAYQKSAARAICNAVIKFKEQHESMTF
jgi:N-acetylmuramoyl-L-alanine amidase